MAAPITANGLLALGATPALSLDPDEIEAFVRSSDALVFNLGMMEAARFEGMPRAAMVANAYGKPFVLDPVFAERSPKRRLLARALIAAGPAVLKMNEAEADAFRADAASRCVSVITGAEDEVHHGARMARLANGTRALSEVTATGCLLGAIIAGALAVEPDPFIAAIAGVSILNIAAELAGSESRGPGSFAVALLDSLKRLDSATISDRLNGEFAHAAM